METPRRPPKLRRDGRRIRPRHPGTRPSRDDLPGADTNRLDFAHETPGPLAASLGLSRMHTDDLEQLGAGMALYNAFYRWAHDG